MNLLDSLLRKEKHVGNNTQNPQPHTSRLKASIRGELIQPGDKDAVRVGCL